MREIEHSRLAVRQRLTARKNLPSRSQRQRRAARQADVSHTPMNACSAGDIFSDWSTTRRASSSAMSAVASRDQPSAGFKATIRTG